MFCVTRSKPQLIVPSTSTPHQHKPLSDIDDQGTIRVHIPVLMFYRNSVERRGEDPAMAIKEGLAKALVFYYPLAGRIFEGENGKLIVNCNGKGVLFVEAKANVKLEQLRSGNSPESNGVDIRPEVNEDNASLPKDFLNSQEEGHNTQNQVNHESGVKVAKGKGAATDIEGNSSDDDFDSSYVDSSLYGIMDSNLLDPIAFHSNIEDGVFGTRSNFASASQEKQHLLTSWNGQAYGVLHFEYFNLPTWLTKESL
nr:methanol O-anthraniloyltransferase-like [Ipomoea batatas]